MDATLAWIKTTFDATARENTLRNRLERLRIAANDNRERRLPWMVP